VALVNVNRVFLILMVCAGCTGSAGDAEPARAADPVRPVEPRRARPVPPGPWQIVYGCGHENHGHFWSKNWVVDLGAQRMTSSEQEGANHTAVPSKDTSAALSPQAASELEGLARAALAWGPVTDEAAEHGGTACSLTIRSATEPHVDHLRMQRQGEVPDPPGALIAAIMRAFKATEAQ
jgi:hypothetical protein